MMMMMIDDDDSSDIAFATAPCLSLTVMDSVTGLLT